MKKTALITGILGQDGPYLAKLLIEKDYKVYGLMRRYTNPNFSNLDWLGITKDVEYLVGDMTDEASLFHVIKLLKPTEVYNLAAQSFVHDSFEQPTQTTLTNALGVIHILNGIRYFSPATKYYQACTSEMFGLPTESGFHTEESPFQPQSPYAISKLYAYWMTNNYRKAYGLFASNGILFNH